MLKRLAVRSRAEVKRWAGAGGYDRGSNRDVQWRHGRAMQSRLHFAAERAAQEQCELLSRQPQLTSRQLTSPSGASGLNAACTTRQRWLLPSGWATTSMRTFSGRSV